MDEDNQLKSTLHEVVLNAVRRMELATDPKTKRCIFQEYKEWLGNSIDDWVLALPNEWSSSDLDFY